MKKLSIILAFALVALASCTKSKVVHPEIGDGNDEIITVGMKEVHVKYIRTDIAELQKVVFHYSIAETLEFYAAEMTKKEDFFELTLNDLVSNTPYDYYYELFYNGGETSITEQKSFRTQAFVTPEPPTPPSGVPEGAIDGLFTINANGDQVYFSQGNLQYQASTNTWRFAEHQWDYVGSQIQSSFGYVGGNVEGSDNHDASEYYSGWIDLFQWGTSGFNHGAHSYQPWSIGGEIVDFNAYGGNNYNLYDQSGQADWGYNAISNGGNTENQWRTLMHEEWSYVVRLRNTTSGNLFVKAIVNGVNGMILLPDGWVSSIYDLYHANEDDIDYGENIIDESDWRDIFQCNGAVFLPAGGFRQRNTNEIDGQGGSGSYWSSSCPYNGYAFHFFFSEIVINIDHPFEAWFSSSVRLVKDAR